MVKQVPEPQSTRGEEIPCHGCGNLTASQTWNKAGCRFQSLDCLKCHLAWGRIPDRSGTWQVLWPLGLDGLKIS